MTAPTVATRDMGVGGLRERIAKAIADHIGHGMAEKCEGHADAVLAALSAPVVATDGDCRNASLLERLENWRYACAEDAADSARTDFERTASRLMESLLADTLLALPTGATDETKVQRDYEHFLAYSGLDDSEVLRYAYFHGADIGLDKPMKAAPATPAPAQQAVGDGPEANVAAIVKEMLDLCTESDSGTYGIITTYAVKNWAYRLNAMDAVRESVDRTVRGGRIFYLRHNPPNTMLAQIFNDILLENGTYEVDHAKHQAREEAAREQLGVLANPPAASNAAEQEACNRNCDCVGACKAGVK